jgi:hypothetical protein
MIDEINRTKKAFAFDLSSFSAHKPNSRQLRLNHDLQGIIYSEFHSSLYSPIKDDVPMMSFTTEIDSMISACFYMLQNRATVFVRDYFPMSPFMRIVQAFLHHFRIMKNSDIHWMKSQFKSKMIDRLFVDFCKQLGHYYIQEKDDMGLDDVAGDYFKNVAKTYDKRAIKANLIIGSHESSTYSGKISLDDINVLLELATVQDCRSYSRAIIHGVHFRGRGPHYAADAEDQFGTEELKMVWHRKRQYSCWCRLLLRKQRLDGEQDKTTYAMINFFFTINIPSDIVISNHKFASVDGRTVQTWQQNSPFKHLKVISATGTIVKARLIVSLREIHSTPVMILPLQEPLNTLRPNLPISLNLNEVKAEYKKYYSQEPLDRVSCFVMIDLEPNRLIVAKPLFAEEWINV